MEPIDAPCSIFGVHPIDKKLFFTVSDDEVIRQVYRQFPRELDRLKYAYSISDGDIVPPSIQSPSEIIYGNQYDEVNRTLVAVLSLRWIYRGQYETFIGSQADEALLSRSSFDWIRTFFVDRLVEPMDLYALLAYIVINDLGKDPQLALDYRSKTGEDITPLNHDTILLKAVEVGLVPCINILPPEYRKEIVHGIRLGAEFNPGQLVQAENTPASLSALLDMRGLENEFTFHFMQQLLDIAGAAGHEDWTCAKKLTQPIARGYQDVYEVAVRVISGNQGLREAYDVILARRSEFLHHKGFRLLDVHQLEDRALTRLLCMGGVSDLEKAELYWATWEDLDDSTKRSLVCSLNVDGSSFEPAVQPTYMPAMLTHGVGQARSSLRGDKVRRLKSILGYLSRVMASEEGNYDHVVVIERSVLWVVKNIIQSPAFQEDPEILDKTEIPRSTVAKTV